MTQDKIRKQCQHCGNHTIFEVKGTYLHRDFLTNGVDHVTEYFLLECMTCSRPMLEQVTKVVEQKVRRQYDSDYYEEYEEIIEEPESSILYPTTNLAVIPLPSSDMPKDVAHEYMEARAIYGSSPRPAQHFFVLLFRSCAIT